MSPEEAREFLRPALASPGDDAPPSAPASRSAPAQGSSHPAVWADLGAGEGTFTRALAALLAPGSRIIAVDRDPHAVEALERLARETPNSVEVVAVRGDLSRLPEEVSGLEGVLMANVLHFLPDPLPLLETLRARVAPGGRVVVVEYDRKHANPWVPYPVTPSRLDALAERAGLSPPRMVGRRPSRYQGEMYVAVAGW